MRYPGVSQYPQGRPYPAPISPRWTARKMEEGVAAGTVCMCICMFVCQGMLSALQIRSNDDSEAAADVIGI